MSHLNNLMKAKTMAIQKPKEGTNRNLSPNEDPKRMSRLLVILIVIIKNSIPKAMGDLFLILRIA